MKNDLHPADYRLVVYQDTSAKFSFLTRSTAKTDESIKWEDGNEYPLVKVHISSASHPFYTGEEKIVDIEGRVDRFKARQKAAADKRSNLSNKAMKAKQLAENKSGPEAQKLGATLSKTAKPKQSKTQKSDTGTKDDSQ